MLRAFGAAFGALPEFDDALTLEQNQFLDQAITDLSEDNKIMPVRLSFFTEMVKDRTWSPVTLREVGGAEGVGIAFLEDIFGGRTANPQHRVHENAARAVLAALLPSDGGLIKGRMRSYKELMKISGYQSRPSEFDSLLRVLDNDLRLITPTESTSIAAEIDDENTSQTEPGRFYHLTHDYLVPALTDWLQQKQKESGRGRAILCMDERASVWNRQKANRQLPTFQEWSNILLKARRRDRVATEPRRQMLRAASRYYGTRIAIVAIASIVFLGGVMEWNGRNRASAYVNALSTARISDVPQLIEKLEPYQRWAEPLLNVTLDRSDPDSAARLRMPGPCHNKQEALQGVSRAAVDS